MKRKILLITTDFPPGKGGGICTHTKFIVDSLGRLGWDFVVLSEFYIPVKDQEIEQYNKSALFPVYRLPSSLTKKEFVRKALFCIKKCKEHKADIIIGTGRHPAWFAAIVSFVCRKPLVTIGHGTEFTQKTSKYDFLINRFAYGYSNLLIAISKYTKEVIMNMKIKPSEIVIINNSADEKFFKKLDIGEVEEFKRQNNLIGKRIILTVGSLSERKGQKIIIQSLPLIKEKFSNVLYVAVGLPTKKDEFERLASDLGVNENVLFPGKINEDELLNWYNACDVFSMTSVVAAGDYEGYGIAVVEAALCGKMAVVSDSAGLKEAVVPNQTGIVVKEGSYAETADAFLQLFENNDLLMEMSENAYHFACENNTWSVKGKEFDYVLSKLIN